MDNRIKLATNAPAGYEFVGNNVLMLSHFKDGCIRVASIDVSRIEVEEHQNPFWKFDKFCDNIVTNKPVVIGGYLNDTTHKNFTKLLKAFRDSLNELDLD